VDTVLANPSVHKAPLAAHTLITTQLLHIVFPYLFVNFVYFSVLYFLAEEDVMEGRIAAIFYRRQ